MLLKGLDKLNDCVENFIFQLGYDGVTCFLYTDFGYYDDSKEIAYSIFETEDSSEGFVKFIQDNYYRLPKCSLFTISLLHELGHYLTLEKFSEKEREEYKVTIEKYSILPKDTREIIIEKQMKYSALPIEKAATDVAVDILRTYKNIVSEFEIEFIETLHEFYVLNNVENE